MCVCYELPLLWCILDNLSRPASKFLKDFLVYAYVYHECVTFGRVSNILTFMYSRKFYTLKNKHLKDCFGEELLKGTHLNYAFWCS